MSAPVLRRSILAAVLATFSALPAAARAEAGAEQRTIIAQSLFDEARRLTQAGKFAEACPKLAESHRLEPSIGTRFYLADCLENTGKLASAWLHYRAVADEARAAGQKDREEFAAERAAAVEPRIARIRVVVSPSARSASPLEITRDGVAVGEGQWGAALPVDPGEHVIAASAPGKQTWDTRVIVRDEGKTITVEVPPLQDARPPEAPKRSFFADPLRIAGLSAGVAGVIGVGVGIGLGAQAISKQNESNAGHCDTSNVCDRIGYDLRHDGITAATGSTIGIVAGGVLLAGGAALVLVASRADTRSKGTALAASRLAVGPGSLVFTGSW